MEDEEIVRLFFARDELAVSAAEEKYGKLLVSLSRNILGSAEDATECLNDALFALWTNIPPENPDDLRAYACKIVRNKSFDRLKRRMAQKRAAEAAVSLDGLEQTLADAFAAKPFENAEFSSVIDAFLQSLNPGARIVFVKRYFFLDTEPQIAADLGMSLSKVKSLLHRSRKRFKKFCTEGDVL